MNVMVTAGPTREHIDPIRFLSNRSTGKMGYAIASAFVARGHEVLLISGPVDLGLPEGVEVVNVVSAAEMCDAVTSRLEGCDALVMAAAVSDWTPEAVSETKLKKTDEPVTLTLQRTPDILMHVAAVKGHRILAGFAAETGDPEPEGMRKLKDKGLNILFANDVSAPDSGFAVDTNRIVCIKASGAVERWELMTKREAGERIAQEIESLRGNSNG